VLPPYLRASLFAAITDSQNPVVTDISLYKMETQGRVARRFWALMIAACALTFPAACRAQNDCPWLNVATASGVLGGPAALTVTKADEGTGICIFKAQTGTGDDSMTISVAQALNGERGLGRYEGHCTSAATPLNAIGNEAVLCASDAAKSRGKQVIGRVRDMVFTVAVNISAATTPGTTNAALTEHVEMIADQVAGNLF
jgi:hypothetical protein